MPVSAKAISARLPASRAACANSTDPKVPGGRKTTCPSMRCGANALAMSACAVAGRRRDNQLSPAHRLADVVRDERSLCLVAAGEVLDLDHAARGAMGCHRCLIAPPQPHLMAGERKIARRGKRAVATPENGNPHQLSLSVTMRGRVIPSHYIRTDASARSTLGTDRVARMSQRGRAKGAPPMATCGCTPDIAARLAQPRAGTIERRAAHPGYRLDMHCGRLCAGTPSH